MTGGPRSFGPVAGLGLAAMRPLSRRGFLGLAAGGVLVACGGGDGGSGDGGSGTGAAGGSGGAAGEVAGVIRFFSDGAYVAGRPERLTFGLADTDGLPLTEGLPDELQATLSGSDGQELARLTAPRRDEGLPRPYYAYDVDRSEPGVYSLRMKVGAMDLETMFTLGAPGSLTFPGVGEPMPAFDTPTVQDTRGVEPYCSRPEPCPFHERTLTDVLAEGKPVAYFIGTPAHCQTGICGPVLDLLIGEAGSYRGVNMVHADVYADAAATTIAPAVQALGLPFEPLLYLIGADGVVRRRLDVIYDTGELRDGLAALAG